MIEKLYDIYQKAAGISTDTRTIRSGHLFFALKGPHFNANKFASEALEKGAIACVIDDPEYTITGKTILAKDVLKTLQELAIHHRKNMTIPFLGITGSNGKTTTKELIQLVLSTKYKVVATSGNLNNHIGVPLTILSVGRDADIAVIEMGANRVGDIRDLCQIARPSHGLITNIGKAHMGLFGGLEGVIRGKSELYDYLKKTNGVVFINENQEILKSMTGRFEHPLLYPNEGSYCQCKMISVDPFVAVQSENGQIIQSRLIGEYNFDNIATALCIAKYFDIDPQASKSAIESYIPTNNRSQIIEKNNNLIISDAYNANPSSMQAALDNLKTMGGNKTLIILGDMFELGDDTEDEHREIGRKVLESKFDINVFCGEHMRHAHEACPGSMWFQNKDLLKDYLMEQNFSGFHILIKGSRGMALEEILEYL